MILRSGLQVKTYCKLVSFFVLWVDHPFEEDSLTRKHKAKPVATGSMLIKPTIIPICKHLMSLSLRSSEYTSFQKTRDQCFFLTQLIIVCLFVLITV